MSDAPKMVRLAHNGGLPNGNYPKSDLVEYTRADLADALEAALREAIGALEFSRDYHADLGNEDQAFAQDKLDAATAALAAYEGRK